MPKEDINTTVTQTRTSSQSSSQIEIHSTSELTEISSSSELGEVNAELISYSTSLKNEPLGIYLKDLTTGEVYEVNDERTFYGASIAKLPIIYVTQKQLLLGDIDLNTSFAYTEAVNDIPGAMIPGGTGIMQQNVYEGAMYSVEDLLAWSILHSDNLASNMLSYYVGGQNGEVFLNQIAPYYPIPLTEFSKDMTARTAGELMEAIYNNEIEVNYFSLTDWAHEKLGILPKEVFHKIGINGSFNHDTGVILGEQPYVFAFLSEGLNNGEMEEIIQTIDHLITKE